MSNKDSAQLYELGKQIAPIVRNAIGALNHTHIGYSSEHDAMADPYIGDILNVVQAHTAAQVTKAELRLLRSIENMGDGEAKHQGMYTAHNMDGYHRAYGEIVAHNVHERIAHLTTGQKKEAN